MAPAAGSRRAVKGLSEAVFPERLGTGVACRGALFAMRWREGLTCPACGHRGLCAPTTRGVSQRDRCRKQASLAAGTVCQDSKLPLATWFAAVYRLAQAKGGISSIGLARRLGVRQPTARLVRHELARAMDAREAGKPKLSGRVEVDDAHLGGERPGGERGRGAAGETPTVAAAGTTAERRPRRLRLAAVEGFRKREVERLAKAAIEPGAAVVSDGLSCRPAVGRAGCPHRPVATGAGERAAGRTPFRWVDTTLGNVETAIAGTYRHVSPEHARSYPTSFAYRFDRRPRLGGIVERLAWAAVRAAPRPYRVVTADG